MVTISDAIVTIVIENASHHLDLRSPNPLDPPSVVAASTTHPVLGLHEGQHAWQRAFQHALKGIPLPAVQQRLQAGPGVGNRHTSQMAR